MAKIDLNKILKPGASKQAYSIDYGSTAKQKELEELQRKRDEALKSKDVDWQKLGSFVVKK